MKNYLFPMALLVLLYVAFFVFITSSDAQLPERIASHFGAAGAVDGWMSRSSYHSFILKFGLLFPLLMPSAMCLIMYFVPDSMINLPNKDYWLAPERKGATRVRLIRPSLWWACLSLGFVMGVHYSIIDANRQIPPHLSGLMLGGLISCFLLGSVFVVIRMIIPFYRTEKPQSENSS